MRNLLTLLLLISTAGVAQRVNTTELSGPSNVYNDAIRRYLILTSEKGRAIYDTLFIQEDADLTDSLMGTINTTKVIVADSLVFQQRLEHSEGRSFILHKVFPLVFNEGMFSIYIVQFLVRQNEGKVHLLRASHFKIDYMFDNRGKTFRFVKGKSYGY